MRWWQGRRTLVRCPVAERINRLAHKIRLHRMSWSKLGHWRCECGKRFEA